MVATGEPFGAVVFAAMRGGATGAFGDFLTWHQLQYTIHTYNIYIYMYIYIGSSVNAIRRSSARKRNSFLSPLTFLTLTPTLDEPSERLSIRSTNSLQRG